MEAKSELEPLELGRHSCFVLEQFIRDHGREEEGNTSRWKNAYSAINSFQSEVARRQRESIRAAQPPPERIKEEEEFEEDHNWGVEVEAAFEGEDF